MKNISGSRDEASGRPVAGLTLIEVVFAVAVAALAAMMLYPVFTLAHAMVIANRQKLEADALAMDKTMEIFNTCDFSSIRLATNLPPAVPPAASLLPANSEIRVMIVPNADTPRPYKWDVEVRVKRDRFWPGGRKVTLTNDTVYRVTRYDIGRN
jgi:Tfp pilus assembly protein PilE